MPPFTCIIVERTVMCIAHNTGYPFLCGIVHLKRLVKIKNRSFSYKKISELRVEIVIVETVIQGWLKIKENSVEFGIVHELEPKKMDIWVRREDKTWYRFLVTSGCLLSRKVCWAVWIRSFWPKLEVFYRSEWTKGGTI